MLKISTKFGVAPESFCENQNSVQNQDQDHDITLDFNTRPTWKTPTKFCLDPLTPSKVIVPPRKVHVRTYIQTDRQTDGNCFWLILSSKTYKSWTFVKRTVFFFTHAITIFSLFTYSVCDERVKDISTYIYVRPKSIRPAYRAKSIFALERSSGLCGV